MRLLIGIGTIALLAGTAISFAQTGHMAHGLGGDHSGHSQMESGDVTILTEPGQGAFAALAEVVRVLESDPDTDWTRVDLDGLRTHLVDMDLVVSDTVVLQEKLPDGLVARATGDAATIAALRRMVPAHAGQLGQDTRWTVSASETARGVDLRVTSDDPATVLRIQGLGFFGLMASQDHHREHHMTMARGEDAHRH